MIKDVHCEELRRNMLQDGVVRIVVREGVPSLRQLILGSVWIRVSESLLKPLQPTSARSCEEKLPLNKSLFLQFRCQMKGWTKSLSSSQLETFILHRNINNNLGHTNSPTTSPGTLIGRLKCYMIKR